MTNKPVQEPYLEAIKEVLERDARGQTVSMSGKETLCSVDGCNHKSRSRGLCNTHYERWRVHGDPNVMKRSANGTGTWRRGKKVLSGWVDGELKEQYESRLIVEELLGRILKYNEIVHHVDGNPSNNSRPNLVVMERAMHSSLHNKLPIDWRRGIKLRGAGMSNAQIAAISGCHVTTVYNNIGPEGKGTKR